MEEPSMNSKARSFTSSEIAEMTSNFEKSIGKGGQGKVFEGTMNNDTKVAVKVLTSPSEQYRKTFQAEVELLTTIHHKNLVSLLGYCNENGKEALIYDYMAKGNLKQILLGKRETILSWDERLQIALDVAHGLEYLRDCKPPIIHRDLKPENILFNTNMEAKIADFGLFKAFLTESASHISTNPAGTFGYLDPEYYNTGHLSKKNDLYSFEIILLELVSGKPAVIKIDNEDAINIIKWIHPLIKRRDIRSIVDRRLNGEFHIKAARGAINIAMSCVMKPITKRPDISHVVAKLKKCSDIEMRSTMVNGTGWFSWLCRIYKNLTEGQKGTKGSNMQLDGAEDKGGFKVTETGQSSEAKNPSFSSGDDELDNNDVVEPDNDPPQKMGDPSVEVTEEKWDATQSENFKAVDVISEGKLDEVIDYLTEAIMLDNTDVVEPDNDPPQKMGDPSVEVTEEKRDAAQLEMLKAVDAIFEGKLGEAIDYLTEAIMLNPSSAILYATRASAFVKLNKPNAAIRDANAAFEINPDSAKGCKIRGIANAMLGRWEEAANDLHIAANLDYDEEIGSVLKKVALNVQKIEEHRMNYERLVKPIKISFSIFDMRQQKSEQDPEALFAFKDGRVIGIDSTSELETKLNAATKTSRLAILYFTATWWGPCRSISPLYTSLAAKYPKVVFLKVDIDEARDVAERWNISTVLTFLFIRNGKEVDKLVGFAYGALERKTVQYSVQSFLDKM